MACFGMLPGALHHVCLFVHRHHQQKCVLFCSLFAMEMEGCSEAGYGGTCGHTCTCHACTAATHCCTACATSCSADIGHASTWHANAGIRTSEALVRCAVMMERSNGLSAVWPEDVFRCTAYLILMFMYCKVYCVYHGIASS